MARGKQDGELVKSFAPGTSIIAKPRGFPAWPALVVADSDVPADVMAVKPGKKPVMPVLFYNDNSFLWITPDEAQVLTREVALKNSKAKVKRTLKDAYAMVADAPEEYAEIMTTFFPIENGAPAEEEVEEVAPSVEASPEPSRRARSASERAAEQKPRISKSRKRVSESPAPDSSASAASTKKNKKETSKKKDPTPTEEEEESEYVDQTEGATDASEEVDLQNSQAARLELCSSARQIFQEYLLVDKIGSTEEVENILKELEEAPEIEIAVVRKSKLNRVLAAAIVQILPIEIMTRLRKLHDQWSTQPEPIIKGIPEHLAPRELSEVPESRDGTPRPESVDLKEETEESKQGSEDPADIGKQEEVQEEVQEDEQTAEPKQETQESISTKVETEPDAEQTQNPEGHAEGSA